jgi:hypothetical protein
VGMKKEYKSKNRNELYRKEKENQRFLKFGSEI